MRLPGAIVTAAAAAATALAAAMLLVACGDDDDAATPDATVGPPPPWEVNGTLVPATAEGLLPAGQRGDGTAILPGGRMVTPTGTQIEVGGFLLGVRLLPGEQHLLTTDGGYYDEYLSIIDVATGALVQREPFLAANQRALFLGLAIRADGRIFASGGGTNAIYSYDYDAAAALPLTKVDELALGAGAYSAGIAFADATRLVAALQLDDSVAVIDTAIGAELARLPLLNGDLPYDIVVDPLRAEAYVSLWGANSVAIVDLAGPTPTLLARVGVGKNPSALLLDPPAAPTRLLVAASDADRVTVVDLATRLVVDEVSVAPAVDAPRGSAPNHLALSPDGSRLYVANAGENCIDVLATATFDRIGRIATGWYPTAVAVSPTTGALYVTNAKGLGGGASGGTGFDYGIMKGTVSLLAPPPADAELVDGEAQVQANNKRMTVAGARVSCPPAGECRFPLPAAPGLPTPIEHVVLIVRENKTYDSELGDLGTDANGDPSMTVFGEQLTPNLHALARQFTNFDNCYSNAEASIQGHVIVTSGISNDFTEKAWLTTWGRGTRNQAQFAERISSPERGHYFQHLGRAGIDYIDYGEVVGIAGGAPDDEGVTIDPNWPGGLLFNLDSKDVLKAEYFASRVLDEGFLPTFSFVMLPNNHTEGTTPGKWTPEYMIADNDEATGRVVEAIANSPFWYTTAIFIIEDDPQDGADHVEAHRTACLLVSPWARRGYTSKVHYDVPSLWHTIELLVGLPPMSQNTADAAAMYDAFATTPDWTPYTHIPANFPEAFSPNMHDAPAEMSKRMDFSTLDNAPGLGRVLWEHFKGTPAPWASMPLPLDYGDEVEFDGLGYHHADDDDDDD